MATSSRTQRAVAEINFGEGAGTPYKIGNRTIHQFWHLYSSHCRHLLLAPQRRPDTGRTAWTWREAMEKRPVTVTELTEVRRRLAEASRSLGGGAARLEDEDDGPAGGGATLEGQVRTSVSEMMAQLIAQRDAVLTGFVCRTEAGLMLHSWGAAVAAEAHYPDTQNGEISGLLMVGDDRPIGVPIALESPQGASIARVKSDSNGHFRFPNIAPGNYRVRVLERNDFPSNGVAVTMEHESITGLELHSNSGETPAPVNGPVVPTGEPSLPWSKRRWTAIFTVLLVLGIGSCVWRITRSISTPTVEQTRSEEWQSAKGQVAGVDAAKSTGDDRKVGSDPAWSSLAKSIQVPKPATAPSPKHSGGLAKGATDRSSSFADDAPLTDSDTVEANTPQHDVSGEAKPEKVAVTRPKSKESSASPAEKSKEEKLPHEERAATPASTDEAKPKSAEAKLAKPSPAAAPKKPPAVIGSAEAPAEATPTESEAAAAESTVDQTPAATTAAAPAGSKAGKGAKTPSPARKGGNPGAKSAEVGADESGANQPKDSAASTSSANQSKPGAGKKSKPAAGDSKAAGAAAGPTESPSPEAVAEASPEKTADETASEKSSLSPAPKKRPAASSASAPANSAETAKEEAAPAEPAPSAATSAPKKTVKKSPVNPGKPPSAAPSSSAAAAATPADSDKTSDAAVAVGAAIKSATPASKKSMPKPAVAAAPNSGGSAGEAPNEAGASAPANPSAGVARAPVMAEAPLVKFGQVRASAWKPRLLQDQILPTHPMTAEEDDAVEAMREKLLQVRRAQIPAAFLQPRAQHGIVLELSGVSDLKESPLRWRDDTGGEPSGATVVGSRAELTWGEHEALHGRDYILSTAAGRERARVSVDSSGALVLKAEPATQGKYWVGVDASPTGGAVTAVNAEKHGSDWRLISGEPIPASWTRDDRWHEGRGRRLEIPLDVTSKRVGNYGIALLDQSTGWALVCDVAVQ